ncbi:MAG: hypothetical protein ACOY81_11060 [Bacillota bacterium]
MMKKLEFLQWLWVVVLVVLLWIAYAQLTGTPEETTEKQQVRIGREEDFRLVQPGDLGKRDYWELARTFDELSSRFIVAFFARDQEVLDQLVAPGEAVNLAGFRDGLQVTHLHQQAVVYENGEYNSIMQVGTTGTETFSYAHVYFQDIAGEWKVSRLEWDA